MKIKTSSLFIVLLLLASVCIFGQEKLSDSEQKIFKQNVLKIAQNTKSIQSDFTQIKHLSVLDNAILSEGNLVFKAPNLVKWEYSKPYKNIAIFKNDKLLVNNEGKKEDIDLSSNRLFRSLNSLIVSSIKGDMFDKSQFEMSFFKYSSGCLVKFIPKDKRMKKFIAAFELKFDKDSSQVTEVKLIEPNEDYTLIVFKNKQLNGSILDSVFKN
jgi:outer membrane lipoprotein carrier protein